jgi:Fibronectin type III domain
MFVPVAITFARQAIFFVLQAIIFFPDLIAKMPKLIATRTNMIATESNVISNDTNVIATAPNGICFTWKACIDIREVIIRATEEVFVMAVPRVKIGLRNASDSEVVTIAINVLNGVKNNDRFPDPTVDLDAFEASIIELQAAIAIRRDAGKPGTADRRAKRRKVETFIRQIAAYVDGTHNDDLDALLSAGFPAKDTHHAPTPIPQAIIRTIKNGITTQLVLGVKKIPNAKTYEVQYAAVSPDGAQGPWQDPIPFTNTRSVRVNDLSPGTTYTFQVRGIGAIGPGDWSDPVSHMCM